MQSRWRHQTAVFPDGLSHLWQFELPPNYLVLCDDEGCNAARLVWTSREQLTEGMWSGGGGESSLGPKGRLIGSSCGTRRSKFLKVVLLG